MKRLDCATLHGGIEHTVSTLTELKSQIERIQRAVRDFVSLEDALRGKGGESIRAFYEGAHQPFLIQLHQSFTDYEFMLKDLQNGLLSFESHEKGYINEAFLENDVKGSLDKVKGISQVYTAEANTVIESVHDIASLPRIDESSLQATVTDGKNKVTEVNEELHSLDEQFTATLEEIEDIIRAMYQFVIDLGMKFKQGQMTVHTFDMKTIENMESFKRLQHTQSNNNADDDLKVGLDRLSPEELANLDEDTKACVEKATEDYLAGALDKITYERIYSGLISTGTGYLRSYLQGKVSDGIATSIHEWTKRNTTFFVDRGLVAAHVHGHNVTFSEPPSALSKTIRTGARHGVPIVGTALDFGLMVYEGEDVTDAAVKSVGHLGAGLAGAAIGTAIGGPVGTFIGFSIGIVGSYAFDAIYDNWGNNINNIKETASKIGDSVKGFFSKLGSCFG